LGTLSTQAPYVPGILQFRKPKKDAEFFNPRFLKKGWTKLYEKCHFLLDMNFLVKKITNSTSNFT
jgi:hypothetical protein